MLADNSIKEISKQTGIDVEEVTSIVEDWATPLMRRGIVVKLSIKRWRATQRISKGDTGLNSKDSNWMEFSTNYLSLGKKFLLPVESLSLLNRIENRGRANLKECSYDTVWGHFVPYNSYAEWKERNEEIKKEYFELANEMSLNYNTLVSEVLEEYKKHAKILYDSIEVPLEKYDSFEKDYLNKIKESIISAEKFRASFEYECFYSFIPIPSEIQKDLLEVESLENQKEEVSKEREIRKIVIADTADLKSKYIDQFLESTVGGIRSMVARVIEDVRDGIDRNENNPTIGKSRTKLLKMIKKIRMLDFYDDAEIQDLLNKLQLDLNKDKEDRSEDEVVKTLIKLETSAKKNIRNLIGGGRFRMVEIE